MGTWSEGHSKSGIGVFWRGYNKLFTVKPCWYIKSMKPTPRSEQVQGLSCRVKFS